MMTAIFEILTRHNSGVIAKRRLKLLLISDRAGCTPELLEMIKDDVIKAVSKYMEVEPSGVEIKVTRMADDRLSGRFPVLCASIPVRAMLTKGTY